MINGTIGTRKKTTHFSRSASDVKSSKYAQKELQSQICFKSACVVGLYFTVSPFIFWSFTVETAEPFYIPQILCLPQLFFGFRMNDSRVM